MFRIRKSEYGKWNIYNYFWNFKFCQIFFLICNINILWPECRSAGSHPSGCCCKCISDISNHILVKQSELGAVFITTNQSQASIIIILTSQKAVSRIIMCSNYIFIFSPCFEVTTHPSGQRWSMQIGWVDDDQYLYQQNIWILRFWNNMIHNT